MARRNTSNNFLDLMRSMLRFLDDRLESINLGINMNIHPGGVFISRLRNRLANLIGGRVESNVEERTGGDLANELVESSVRDLANNRTQRRRARRNPSETQRAAPSSEERRVVDRCNRILNEVEGRPVRGRRYASRANSSEENNVGNRRDRESFDPAISQGLGAFVTTSFVVTDNGLVVPSSSVEEQNRSRAEDPTPNISEAGSDSVPGRTLRVVFPHTPSQELRLLFFASQQNERPRESVVYEIQINFDTFDVSSDAPVTATKESLKKSETLRATVADESCECAICMANFVKCQRLRVLPCEHRFHAGCVDKWLLGHSNKCPVCRTSI